jgi:hypothetical protein
MGMNTSNANTSIGETIPESSQMLFFYIISNWGGAKMLLWDDMVGLWAACIGAWSSGVAGRLAVE